MKYKLKLTPLTLLIGVCVMAGALAFLTQYIPLNEIPFLRDYVEISIQLTTLGDITSGASFPDATKVYYSFSWLMAPLFFIICWRWGKASDGKHDALLFVSSEKLTIWNRLGLLLLTPVWAGLCIGGWYAFDGGDARLFKVGSSLTMLVCFGWVAPAALGSSSFLFLASIKKAFLGKI